LPLARRLTDTATTIFIVFAVAIMFAGVDHAVHVPFAFAIH
jgi:hypothetical protein